MKLLKQYTFVLFCLLLLSGCADRTFEWISIKPEKINLAREAVLENGGVRKVDMTFTLQEKSKENYFNDANTYLTTQNSSNSVIKQSPKTPAENPNRRLGSRKTFITSKSADPLLKKSVVNEVANVPEKEKKTTKLNDAIKFHKNLKPKLSSETTALRNETMHQMLNDKKREDLSSNKISEDSTIESKEKTDRFSKIKSSEDIRKGQSIMWVGLILVLLGGILGFIFGKNAFYITGAGLVFAIIGYFIKM
ncbi:MAG: hypothetical protein ABIP95_15665 [Pelobium sp.]